MKHLIFDCVKEMQPCGLRAVAKQLDADYDEVKELAEELVDDGKLIKQSNQQFKVASGKGSTPSAKHAWRKPVSDNQPLPEPQGPTVREMIDVGLLSEPDFHKRGLSLGDVLVVERALETATTDELIEAVKRGKQAAEIIRERLKEVGL